MIDPETEHLMSRAKEEAVLAIQAKNAAAARAHQSLAVRYSTKAAIGWLRTTAAPSKVAVPSRSDSLRRGRDPSVLHSAAVISD
jgi:hypothetical protein